MDKKHFIPREKMFEISMFGIFDPNPGGWCLFFQK
jgi:hypothetical protein